MECTPIYEELLLEPFYRCKGLTNQNSDVLKKLCKWKLLATGPIERYPKALRSSA